MFWNEVQDETNQFRGKEGLLALYRLDTNAIELALQDVETDEDKHLFWSLIIRLGDIKREHNLLKKAGIKGLGDGNALRRQFHKVLVDLKVDHYPTLVKLMPVIHEFTNFENLLYPKNKTDRKTGRLLEEASAVFQIKDIIAYIRSNWDDWSFTEKQLVLKFMPKIPRTKPGQKKKPHTIQRDAWNMNLIKAFTEEFDMTPREYTKLRGEYNKATEAVKFSVPSSDERSISQMSEVDFFKWIEHVPAEARKRMYSRIAREDSKWYLKNRKPVITAYREWENSKKAVLDEARVLKTKKVAATRGIGGASLDSGLSLAEEERLQKLNTLSKVTTGANTFISVMSKYKKGEIGATEANNMFDQLLDEIDSQIKALVVIDSSGSMSSLLDTGLSTFETALVMATAFMVKNHTPLFMTFDSEVRTFAPGVKVNYTNRYSYTNSGTVEVPNFINPNLSFLENYKMVSSVARNNGRATHFHKVGTYIANYAKNHGINLMEEYPIIMLVSDNEFNGWQRSVNDVAQEFKNQVKPLGWDGLLIPWEMRGNASKHMSNIDQVIPISGSNPGEIDDLVRASLTVSIKDGYLPLKKIHEDPRYSLIKEYI